jgi:hypothetical protein
MTSSERLALALALSVSLFAPVARAQTAPAPSAQEPSAADLETARALYKEGKELRAHGDLAGALAKLKAAHELGRTPITGLELARTYEMLHLLVEARAICLDIGRIPVASDETERSANARAEAVVLADQLRGREATLVVHFGGVPPGAAVSLSIDKGAVPPAATAELHKVNPGTHDLEARVEGRAAVTATVDVKEGETREVSLTLPPPPVVHVERPRSPPPPPPPPPTAPRNSLATAGFVIGGVGIAVGSLTGLLALSKKSDLDSQCPQKVCPTTANDDLDSAKAWATFSTVAFVAGGVGAAVGLIALVAGRSNDAPHEGAALFIGPGSVGVHGAF